MRIEVWLFSSLSQYLPAGNQGRRVVMELPEGATLNDLAELLGIRHQAVVGTVNDEQAHGGLRLHDGDRISFFPPLAGG